MADGWEDPALIAGRLVLERELMRHPWRKAIGAAATLTVGLAVLAGGVWIRQSGVRFDPVLSGSMRPGVQPGDLAVVLPVAPSTLQVGDVIVFVPPMQTTPVLHRIVSIEAGNVTTKGDANDVADPWGPLTLRGPTAYRLVAVIPVIGWLTEIRSALLVGMGLLLLLAVVAPPLRGRRRVLLPARWRPVTRLGHAKEEVFT